MGTAVLLSATMVLAGCSSGLSGLLGGDKPAPQANRQIPVNNELALPPDLSLAPPGSAPLSSPAAVADGGLDTPVAAAPRQVAPAPVAPVQDVYEKYGISKLNADGTPKDEGKLREELRQAVLAEKRKKNPRYGTIFNIGELFNDN